MIDKKLINFKKESDYNQLKEAGNIKETSIVFIDDAKKIVTHNTEFDCSGEADWNANEGQPGFIKNKPVVEVEGENLIKTYSNINFTYSTNGFLVTGFGGDEYIIYNNIILGDKYKVIINDKEYVVECKTFSDKLYLSDDIYNGNPFVGNFNLYWSNNRADFYIKSSESTPVNVNISIYHITGESKKQFDPSYLPIVQETGDSEDKIMSQKAVTEALTNAGSGNVTWDNIQDKPFEELDDVNYIVKDKSITIGTDLWGEYYYTLNIPILSTPNVGDKCKIIIDGTTYSATLKEIDDLKIWYRLILTDASDEDINEKKTNRVGNWSIVFPYNGNDTMHIYFKDSKYSGKNITVTIINESSKSVKKLDPKFYNEGGFELIKINNIPRVLMLESNSVALGDYSVAEGCGSVAKGYSSHSEGNTTNAIGDYSHSEGYYTAANGNYSHTEGYYSIAEGYASHAEGLSTTASGSYSHSEGGRTTASGLYSHSEGYEVTAKGYCSHSEGYNTQANSSYSHTEGFCTTAKGDYSHTEGYYTETNNPYEHASGTYNISTTGDSNNATLFSVGNGHSSIYRHNAFEIKQNGNIYIPDTNAEGSYSASPMLKLQDCLFISWTGTQEEYDAITTKDSNTFYFIKEEE